MIQAALLLASTRLLVLKGTTNLLGTVLLLLALLTTTLGSLSLSKTDLAELGLELGEGSSVIVDEGKASALTTTKGILETEGDNTILVNLVHGTELLSNIDLAHTSRTGMDNIDNLPGGRKRRKWSVKRFKGSIIWVYHLLAGKETVSHKFAGADGNRSVSSLNEK